MKKHLAISLALFIVATIVAIPVIVVSTTKTVGSISYADAEQIVDSGMLSAMNENEVIQKLGNPDFRIELDGKTQIHYEIEREVHAFMIDYMPEQLCISIDRSNDQVIDVYISD